MLEGTISKLDLENRTAQVTDRQGNEITIRFTERTNVDVVEPETMGTMAGELEDLEEGYVVELELTAESEDGTFYCDSVHCIS